MKLIVQKLAVTPLLLTLLVSQVVNASEFEQNNWKNPNYITESFIQIAHGNEYSQAISTLRKWQQNISYQINDETADLELHAQLIDKHLKHLASITGLSITQSPVNNLTIFMTSETKLDQLLKSELNINDQKQRENLIRNSVCIANIKTSKNGLINKAIVIIPVDRARAHAKLLSCIVEELTQVLGLPNDSDKVFPSIFNDHSHNDFLSGLDYIFLKLLYSSELKAGMSVEQSRKRISDLLKQNKYQSMIMQAEKLVKENSIEAMLK